MSVLVLDDGSASRETKFTAGPFQVVEDDVWDTRGDGEPGVPLVRADFGSDRRWGRKISREEIAANMVLFAAAPELYEALVLMAREADLADVRGYGWDDAREKTRAALAKARGEA